MHTYTVDNENRTVIIAIIGGFSLIITQAIRDVLSTISKVANSDVSTLIENFGINPDTIPLEFLSDLFSGLGQARLLLPATFTLIFIILYSVFRERIWDQNWVPSYVASAPDLSGEWKGYIITDDRPIDEHIREEMESEGNHEDLTDTRPETEDDRVDGKLKIKQNWRKMSINYKDKESHSYSQVASFRRTEGPTPELCYMFENVPENPKGSYNGVVRVIYIKEDDGKEVLRGTLFNAPAGEDPHGKVYFEREDVDDEDVDNEEGEVQ